MVFQGQGCGSKFPFPFLHRSDQLLIDNISSGAWKIYKNMYIYGGQMPRFKEIPTEYSVCPLGLRSLNYKTNYPKL